MISVIIPTYAPNDYIIDCLTSLNQQTLSKDLFEVIIVLNGTKEPFYNYLVNITQHLSFSYKLLFTKETGVSNARNIGIEHSIGNLFCFIDDDDLVSPDYLKLLLEQAKEEAIIVANVKIFANTIKDTQDDYISKAFKYFTNRQGNIFQKRKFLSSACCKLIPRSIIGSNRFNKKVTLGEDSLFMFSISKRVKQIELGNEQAIYYRRCRKNSASRSYKSIKKRTQNFHRLIFEYSKMYVQSPEKYNLLLFLSRIIACCIKVVK